ncbi:DNA cross-link repair protein PSO2/SNM1 [Lithohypha guttulata]|uniref:DNA cross-link repair protein PSO2/SNM1 n=1 Tax=Lithohypha guttulata TaxID=1690604 RepID=A0AAN7Y5D0_9EURO|nr:DNA cross-link repair protein PSO2/SNM1 [Lithohypha guttulata]
MFRNPRENAALSNTEQVLPSTGRPPTPPSGRSTSTQSPFFADKPKTDVRSNSNPVSRMPVLGTIPQTKISTAKRNTAKQNQSILSFFGKAERKGSSAESPSKGADLFFEETTPHKQETTKQESQGSINSPRWDNWSQDESRFNEIESPLKRRRIDQDTSPNSLIHSPTIQPVGDSTQAKAAADKEDVQQKKQFKQRGGFIDDSDDDEGSIPGLQRLDDVSQEQTTDQLQTEVDQETPQDSGVPQLQKQPSYIEVTEETKVPLKPPDEEGAETPERPQLKRQGTSGFQVDEFGPEDFDDEFFPEGEEFMERQYMEEQLAMERAFDDDSKSESGTEGATTPRLQADSDEVEEADAAVAACPICNGLMKGMSETEASTHVNACLDGTAKPLPQPPTTNGDSTGSPSVAPQLGQKRFQRAAIARPGQANPLSVNEKGDKQSAFSQLMSGHAEDRAWAEAAVNEAQSRGKQAYQRTCPFYKIMPGLYICVDAFRYGKVEGQNAYFLSHFHSDHYIGLTSQWCHGPIYASKVTCNLMAQQLRVNPKWLVPLEFEKKVEVPNTKGVHVTMIPANHCPGSSLYLFEKVIGKNKDGSPKLNRILHCGDFRACPAHIHHPQLRPDVLDAISGQTKEQKIDTCYLDTTYLTPKYSFPSQSDVIDACAQMCISLSKEIVDTNDSWEQVKLERQGSTMKKFLEAGVEQSPSRIKKEADAEEEDVKPKKRGRLLVVVGTYSIGKERICLGIARALSTKIYCPPPKMRICRALEDQELNSLLTSNPTEAQVHMQMLMEIRAETLHDYLVGFRSHFSRVVGFRPTGWSYRPPSSRMTDNPAVNTVLHSENWKSRFTMKDLVPQRGSTRESNCFGVPYSEHSSFRELTMFCCALRIGRVIPTVNVGSAKSREKMKGWIERWDIEKRKNGLFTVPEDNIQEGWGSGDGKLRVVKAI